MKNAQHILDVRSKYTDNSLADLYDSLTMPLDLRKVHEQNDQFILKLYGLNKNATESEIISKLFEMYESLIK